MDDKMIRNDFNRIKAWFFESDHEKTEVEPEIIFYDRHALASQLGNYVIGGVGDPDKQGKAFGGISLYVERDVQLEIGEGEMGEESPVKHSDD